MRRVVLVAFLLAISAGAAAQYVGYDGYDGQSGYGSSPVVVSIDTVTIVFTTEATPADTLVYPASPTIYDIARIDSLNAIIIAEDATIYRLGTGFDVPTFAHSVVAKNNADGVDANIIEQLWSSGSFTVLGLRYLSMDFPVAERAVLLEYVPYEDYIPAGSQIVYANTSYKIADFSPASYSYKDTVTTVLMEHAGWDQWMIVKDVGSYTDYAHASWDFQEDTNSGAWTGTQQSPWVPTLDSLAKKWDVGGVNDWYGTSQPDGVSSKGTIVGGKTNCVQAIVNGATNNGTMMIFEDFASFASVITLRSWDGVSTTIGRTPVTIIQYLSVQYLDPFPGGEWAFVFQTDDAVLAANDAYASVMNEFDGKYTIYAADRFSGAAGFADNADLVRYFDGGEEVSMHTLTHPNPAGMDSFAIATPPYSAADTSTVDWDGLHAEMAPDWLYARADLEGRDLRGEVRFGKSLALPNNKWSPHVTLMAARLGLETIRTQAEAGTNVNGVLGPHAESTLGSAEGDTARLGVSWPTRELQRNMVMLPNSMAIEKIVGIKTDTVATWAQIKNNMRRAIWQARGNDTRVVSLFVHDFKTSPTVPGYGEGLDEEELRAICSTVYDENGVFMTSTEYGMNIKARAIPFATPSGYGQDALFKYTPADRVWFKPWLTPHQPRDR